MGRLPSDAGAQQADDEPDEPRGSNPLCEDRIGRPGNRNNRPTRLQYVEGFFQRRCVLAVQDYIVVQQYFLEIIFLVVDGNVRAEALYQIGVGMACGGGYSRPDMFG